MKKLYIIFVSLCFVLLVKSQPNVTISGICKNNKGYKNIYIDDLNTNKAISKDTILPDGSFKISATISGISIYKLRFGYEGLGLFLILNQGDRIKLTLDMNDLNNPVVEGSEDTKLIYTIIQELKKMDKKIDDETARMQKERQDYLFNTLRKNSNSLAILFFTDEATIEKDINLMKQLSGDLKKKYAGNPFVTDFSDKVNEASFLSPGTEAPEIELPDTSGKMIKLSSLRGNYVIIDFWASWCGPCRAANPELIDIYEKYKNKKFKIYGVSLDKKRDSWVSAIQNDKLTWLQVSDLKFWESQPAVTYRVTSIPYSILVDPQGRIVSKGLRPDELKKKLELLLK